MTLHTPASRVGIFGLMLATALSVGACGDPSVTGEATGRLAFQQTYTVPGPDGKPPFPAFYKEAGGSDDVLQPLDDVLDVEEPVGDRNALITTAPAGPSTILESRSGGPGVRAGARLAEGTVGAAVLATADKLYVDLPPQRGQTQRNVAVLSRDGQRIERIVALPTIRRRQSETDFRRGNRFATTRAVTFLPPESGHGVTAILSDGSNLALFDTASGETASLPDLSTVHAAASDGSGHYVLVANDILHPKASVKVLVLDAQNWSMLYILDTGIVFERESRLLGASVLAVDGRPLIYLVDGGPGGTRAQLLDAGSPAGSRTTLPGDLGFAAALGKTDGRLYLYGGKGENRVASVDPRGEDLVRDIPGLRAPDGAFIQTLSVS